MRYTSVSDLTQEEAMNWLYEQKNVDFSVSPNSIEECDSFFVRVGFVSRNSRNMRNKIKELISLR